MKKQYVMSLILLLLLVTSVTAQDIPVFCGDLPAADCTLLEESSAAMRALDSTAFTLQTDVMLSDLPDLPVDTLEFNLSGEGDFAADLSLFTDMMLTESSTDTGTFFDVMADMLRGIDADVSLTMRLPELLTMMLPDTDLPEEITLDLLMVDGVAYVNLEDLAALDPEGSIPAGWLGIDLAELYGEVLPGQFEAGDMGMFDVSGMVQELMEPTSMAQFMTIERLDDVDVMGQPMAVFYTHLNYQNLLDIPAFRAMLEEQIADAVESDDEYNEAMAILEEVYQGMVFDITQMIGLEDHLVHSTEWTFDWDMAFIPDLDAEAKPHFNAMMRVETTAFNTDFQVEVPEDATLLPLGAMLMPQ